LIDERYHIYSLAAVFFALAIGIVIGTSISRYPSSEGEKRTVERYERWMKVLKTEIEKASHEARETSALARSSEEFCQAVLPEIARDRLAWRNVAIVRTGGSDELSGSVKRALELAGAQVTSVTEINQEFAFDDDGKIAQALLDSGVPPLNAGQKAKDKLWGIMARGICNGTHAKLLAELEKRGVAELSGRYDRANKLVVLVGGAGSNETNLAESVDAQLLAQMDSPDVIVVGCEATGALSSYVPVWRKAGIATVDNADTAIGQMALLCALNGERASFGVKKTADRLIPQSLENE
jgi:hypothetical protein